MGSPGVRSERVILGVSTVVGGRLRGRSRSLFCRFVTGVHATDVERCVIDYPLVSMNHDTLHKYSFAWSCISFVHAGSHSSIE